MRHFAGQRTSQEKSQDHTRRSPSSEVHLFVPDEPAKTDALDFKAYVDGIADLIADEGTSTPLTMGILGEWGTGKTSLMHQVEDSLKSKGFDKCPNCHTLWINVWKLSLQEQDLGRSFLQAVITKSHEALTLSRRIKYDWYLLRKRLDVAELLRQLAANSYRLLLAALPMALALVNRSAPLATDGTLVARIDPLTGGLLSLALSLWLILKPGIEAARERISLDLGSLLQERTYEMQISVLEELQSDYDELVSRWTGGQGRLVIFVDDLDRCPPRLIPGVFEAIKLFMTSPGCVYVLAVDHEVVARSIQVHYGSSAASKPGDPQFDGRRYLEKVLQLPFVLPSLEIGDIRAYIDSFSARWPDSRCAEIFAAGLHPNPRQIKRAVNVFLLLWKLAQGRLEKIGQAITALRLAKVVVLQTAYPELFERLKGEPLLLARLEEVSLDQALPPEFESYIPRSDLERIVDLFKCSDDVTEARFKDLDEDELTAFFSLARRVPTEVELAATSRVVPPVSGSQPAAKKGDIVTATDVHVVQPPGFFSPIPTPHPFRGVLSSNLSPNVLIMGQPAALEGSIAINTPPHIPIGGTFITPPKNRGTIASGSQSVLINGRPAARHGDPVLTCNDPTDLPVGTVTATGTVLIG